MPPQKRYSPVSATLNPNLNLEIYKQRQEEFKQRKIKYLKALAPIKCLPSFLVRSFQDYVSKEKNLSMYELFVIHAWEKAGLDRSKATLVLERLYSLGEELTANLDPKILKESTSTLDARLVKEIAAVKWADFLETRINPQHLQAALQTGNFEALNTREKAFLSCQAKTYGIPLSKANLSQLSPKLNWMTEMKRGKYFLAEGYRESKNFNSAAALLEYAQKIAISPPPPPEKKVCAYHWELNQLGHKIDNYSEATGDDPVFIVNLFKRSDYAHDMEILLAKPHIYKPEDDEKHTHFRKNFRELYHPYNDYLGTERPVVVVSAFENDDYFSDNTEDYMDFGLDLASQIAAIDPTGISSIVVLIVDLAWDIVCFIDYLDDDDFLGTTTYEFQPSMIPEGTSHSNPFAKQVDLKFEKGDSMWRYRVEFISRGVVYITE